MKKFGDLPIYFIIIGLLLNIIIYFYNRVPFINLMIRSSIVIILFAAIGYFLAFVLNDAHTALANNAKRMVTVAGKQTNSASTIDIRLDSEEEDELLKILPLSKDEEFVEVNPESFKTFMNKD
ncbi:MAG: hypothetical protein A2Y23_03670 [Clostridiales bacterium GWB2_37_7]|nr:MAG: hypothetical protein A2Y23_03670 [Clostridiales bacterium GWB2_37_7]